MKKPEVSDAPPITVLLDQAQASAEVVPDTPLAAGPDTTLAAELVPGAEVQEFPSPDPFRTWP